MNNADTRNESPFKTKTASRPSHAATTPPIVAPSTRCIDHVVDEGLLARLTSARGVMLGIRDLRAGSKTAAMIVSASSSGYTSHTMLRDRTSSMEKTITTRITSAAIITFFRL